MKFEITQSPNSYLLLELSKNEKIIIEKGCLIYSDGEYDFENKIELESYKNIVSKIFGGKSLTYNIYTAKEELRMGFSAKDTAEIFSLEINQQTQILFYGSQHFARTTDIQIKSGGMSQDFLVKTEGSGILFLKVYGTLIEKLLDSKKPIYVDEDALIAFEEGIEYEWITGGIKKLITSGEGGLFKLRGKGKIWIQSKDKIEYKKD
tara:strand:- start:55 stop:672 length:618 start_codon:yes stop_codon:yes gene_type:complete